MNKSVTYTPQVKIELWETPDIEKPEYIRLAGSVTQKVNGKIRNSFNIHLCSKAWQEKYQRNFDMVAEAIADSLFNSGDVNLTLNHIEK